MLDIKRFEDIRGNNVVIYSIKSLIEKGTYPHFSIIAGYMGVGKSTVARLIAERIHEQETPITVVNFGLDVNMSEISDDIFKLNPSKPRVVIFEEMHGLNKSQQTSLLTMLDKQPENIYVIATTTELYKILSTIRSRATVWDFKLLGEKQLAQLLDDYLEQRGAKFTKECKQSLLRAARGVPRDLLKNADLAIDGEFTDEQLHELLGQVSDDLIYTLLCSLKTTSIDFALNLSILLDGSNKDKLYQMRDFFTRFLLERKGIEGSTLSKEKISTLNSVFSDEELSKIGKTLVRSTADTLVLELTLLNLELSKTSKIQEVGQQIDRVASNHAKVVSQLSTDELQKRKQNSRISAMDLKDLKLT